MTIPFPSAGPASHHSEDELRWSKSERAIARKAFDHIHFDLFQEPQAIHLVSQSTTRARSLVRGNVA